MKYKQRVLVLSTTALISLLLVSLKSYWKDNTYQWSALSYPCDSRYPKDTADLTVNAIYDDLNFTLNSKDGLYIVHEKGHVKKPRDDEQNKGPLQIIVVPHSHNDPGWLWTFDNYYYIRTQSILTNTVKFLQQHKDFRMIWTETVFLEKWWKEAQSAQKSLFRELVHGGQIEILSGGWVSVDEATTHYMAVLDQLIEGHQWIKEHLGVFPNTSWSIDPFGYSNTLPYLWKKAGMKNMAILRIHGAVKGYMGNRNMLTFDWRQPWDELGNHDITCHVEPYTLYNIECSCGPDTNICKRLDFSKYGPFENPIGIEGTSRLYSFEEYVQKVVEQYKQKASLYKHNVILMPHGDDFRYIEDFDFQVNYDNMKKVMDYVNKRKEFNVQMKFGSVGEYFDILKSEIKKSKSPENSISGDFFTYTDKDHEYWSGYFTTRPFNKRMIRELMELLRATEIFSSLIYVYLLQNFNVVETDWDEEWKSIQNARRQHGLLQHHDAITGTSAAETVIDFETRISNSIGSLIKTIENSITKILNPGEHTNMPELKLSKNLPSPKHQLQSIIIPLSTETTSLVLLNPYSRLRTEIITILTSSFNLDILDSRNMLIPYQIGPIWSTYGTVSPDGFRISFEVKLPPLGISVFKLKRRISRNDEQHKNDNEMFSNLYNIKGAINNEKNHVFTIHNDKDNSKPNFVLENDYLKLLFFRENGMLQTICFKTENFCTDVKINFVRYIANNSNAYCFNSDTPAESLKNEIDSVTLEKGRYKSEVKVHHRLFTHSVVIYNTKGIQGLGVHIENNATLSYPTDKDIELMMRLATSIRNKDFYTDSNGYQMMSRKNRNNLPIGANFYPMTTMAVLQDEKSRLTLHSAQPLGVASLAEGEIEVMVERMPMSFGKGLDESVTDNKPAHSKFVIQIERFSSIYNKKEDKRLSPSLSSHLTNDLLQHPVLQLFSVTGSKFKVKELDFLETESLPCDVIFANFRSLLSEDGIFLGTGVTFHKRFITCETVSDLGEEKCSKVTKLDHENLFKYLEADKIKKMSLSHLYETTGALDVNTMELESFRYEWKK